MSPIDLPDRDSQIPGSVVVTPLSEIKATPQITDLYFKHFSTQFTLATLRSIDLKKQLIDRFFSESLMSSR